MEKSFTKKLNDIDIERRLLLSENCIKDFPRGHEAYLKFKDEDGQVWTFRCRVPPGGGSKPALSGDWFLFVRSKDLKVGDVIEIALDREKDQAAGEQFTIKIMKTTSTTRN
uniref:TF-B3 domain-containing protein n=1 Tax=Populus alba TaxID=43335 RepID=A0A4U5NBA1_POPAL|nr:hypothetical protein D5086_0000272100 [Populus alba]